MRTNQNNANNQWALFLHIHALNHGKYLCFCECGSIDGNQTKLNLLPKVTLNKTVFSRLSGAGIRRRIRLHSPCHEPTTTWNEWQFGKWYTTACFPFLVAYSLSYRLYSYVWEYVFPCVCCMCMKAASTAQVKAQFRTQIFKCISEIHSLKCSNSDFSFGFSQYIFHNLNFKFLNSELFFSLLLSPFYFLLLVFFFLRQKTN